MNFASLTIFTIIILCAFMAAKAFPLEYDASPSALVEVERPDQVVRVLQGLIRSIMVSQDMKLSNTEKRGLDLGLSRGFSGQRAAKHLVGLANAEFAGGPGKKR